MPIHYINNNGTVVPEDISILTADNRAFRYGDGLFETMLWKDGDIRFLQHHIDRLQKGMSMLLLDGYSMFDEFFVRKTAEDLIRKNNMLGQQVRIRLIVYRDGGGLYTPQTNRSAFIMQVQRIEEPKRDKKIGLIVDLYTTYRKPYSELSQLKSNNSLIYVMAGIYKKQFDYDDVLLLNQEGYLCEALTSNIFIYYEKTLYTPALTEACVEGVMRRVVMDIARQEGIPVVEAQISPEIMKRADEIFCTNAVQGVQWVMGYKQKRYFNKISRILQEKLATWNYDNMDL